MRDYKFYRMKSDGHIDGRAIVHALPDDRAAIRQAKACAGGLDVEIWQGARMVAYVVSDETKQTPPPVTATVDRHK